MLRVSRNNSQRCDMPVAIAFIVNTDGRLPTGPPFKEAIEKVDAESDGRALYFLINCAHPDHVIGIFNDEPWMHRLRGIVANASRCSHGGLEVAEELDEGNPDELGALVRDLRKPYPHFNIVGDCSGFDMWHMKRILEEANSAY